MNENLCKNCKNNDIPSSQSPCHACKDNDAFKPTEEAKRRCISELEKVFRNIKNSFERASEISETFRTTVDHAKIIELTEKLDRAIEDLKKYTKCETCRFLKKGDPDFCLADGCSDGDCWEWRYEHERG